jgi:hypothetical protein
LLIDLQKHRTSFLKKYKQKDYFSLKELRKITDQYVADKVLDAISGELTGDVLEWYDRIKTSAIQECILMDLIWNAHKEKPGRAEFRLKPSHTTRSWLVRFRPWRIKTKRIGAKCKSCSES